MSELAGKRKHATVIGGSIAGLFSAVLLLREGWDVHVFERAADDIGSRGGGIATHIELLQVLGRLPIKMGSSFGIDVFERLAVDTRGRIFEMQSHPQTFGSWSRIYHILRELLPDARYHAGRTFVRCEPRRDSVRVIFDDGSAIESDIVVGADGFQSSVRAQFAPATIPNYVGYIAWRGVVPDTALSSSSRLREILPYFAFCLLQGGHVLGYPVPSANDIQSKQRHYNFIWYRPTDERELRRMLTDAGGVAHNFTIPPRLICTAVVDQMRQAAAQLLPPQFAEAISHSQAPFFTPIYEVASERLAFDRVVLLGDAAFTARPHIGAGVTKAAEDAVALTEALRSNGTEKALLAYESARLPVGRAILGRARDLAAHLQAGHDDTEEAFQLGLHRRANALLEDAADLQFLRISPPASATRL